MKVSIIDLSEYINSLCTHNYRSLTNVELQKLLKELIDKGIDGLDVYDAYFEDWGFGVVNPDVYRYYSYYGFMPIIETDKIILERFRCRLLKNGIDLVELEQTIEDIRERL